MENNRSHISFESISFTLIWNFNYEKTTQLLNNSVVCSNSLDREWATIMKKMGSRPVINVYCTMHIFMTEMFLMHIQLLMSIRKLNLFESGLHGMTNGTR